MRQGRSLVARQTVQSVAYTMNCSKGTLSRSWDQLCVKGDVLLTSALVRKLHARADSALMYHKHVIDKVIRGRPQRCATFL